MFGFSETGQDMFAGIGSSSQAFTVSISDSISVTDTIQRVIQRSIRDVFVASSVILLNGIFILVLADIISLGEYFRKAFARSMGEQFGIFEKFLDYKNGDRVRWSTIAKTAQSIWTKIAKTTIQSG